MRKEFITFISRKTNVKNLELIEKDVLIHAILKELYSSEHFAKNYLLKGGTCLVKCYFGYYRFSVDLDFTFPYIGGLSKKKHRELITNEVKEIVKILENVSKDLNLTFKPYKGNKFNNEFVGFIGTDRRKTAILNLKTDAGDIIKVEVAFFEKLLYGGKKVSAKSLLSGLELSTQERNLYKDELEKYSPIQVLAYKPEEILLEKIRAIFTRETLKARDLYDIYILYQSGYDYKDFKRESIEKIKNTPGIKIRENVLNDIAKSDTALEAELTLYVMRIDDGFWDFLEEFKEFLEKLYDDLQKEMEINGVD